MPTDLGQRYAVDWRGTPPYMLATDVPVWYRFLEQWGHLFQALYYQCLVGGPWYTQEQLLDPMLRMWRATTSKRIDALAETENEIWIIEVAKSPGLRAVGQLQVYRALWVEDPKIAKPEKMVLVCEHVDTDLIAAAAMYGILVYVTPL